MDETETVAPTSPAGSLAGLEEAVAASDVPVGPVVFRSEQGIEAIRRGASYVVIGHPILAGKDPRARLADFARSVRGTALSTPDRSTE